MREKNQETRADIIAEMRMGNPVGPCAYRIGLPDKEEVYESGAKRRITMIKDVTVQELADRLEAAEKREKAQPGNATEMRVALLRCEAISCLPEIREQQYVRDMRNIIADALAAPPRNCDVGTAEEQERRFEEFCHTFVTTIAEGVRCRRSFKKREL